MVYARYDIFYVFKIGFFAIYNLQRLISCFLKTRFLQFLMFGTSVCHIVVQKGFCYFPNFNCTFGSMYTL